jgi:hypothetical protein
MSDTPETDAAWACFKGYTEPLQDVQDLSRKLERERDEAREALREAIQFRDTTLNGYDLDAWLKAAGLKP